MHMSKLENAGLLSAIHLFSKALIVSNEADKISALDAECFIAVFIAFR